MTLTCAKGTRDIEPSEMALRTRLISGLRRFFKQYGFEEIETPLLEQLSTLLQKNDQDANVDITQEIFTLQDRGKRNLGLRFDLTVPFARFILTHPEINMPFKRFQIAPVFRDGPLKKGRYRQFWQCDADVVGASSLLEEQQLISMIADIFKWLETEHKLPQLELRINHRKLLTGLLDECTIPFDLHEKAIIALDKYEKLTRPELQEEFKRQGIQPELSNKLLHMLEHLTLEQLDQYTSPLLHEAKADLSQLFDMLPQAVHHYIRFVPTLARGLNYYTGIIFEGFCKKSSISSSLCAGGRYDKLTAHLGSPSQQQPALGISFGLDVLVDICQEAQTTFTYIPYQVHIISIHADNYALQTASSLRQQGISCVVGTRQKGISKALTYASNKSVPYVIILGSKEESSKTYTLKNMNTGESSSPASLQELLTLITSS